MASDGFLGLWRGSTASLIRNVPGIAMYMTGLSRVRVAMANSPYFAVVHSASPSEHLSTLPRLSATGNLIAGATTRVGVGFLLNPFSVLKARYEVCSLKPPTTHDGANVHRVACMRTRHSQPRWCPSSGLGPLRCLGGSPRPLFVTPLTLGFLSFFMRISNKKQVRPPFYPSIFFIHIPSRSFSVTDFRCAVRSCAQLFSSERRSRCNVGNTPLRRHKGCFKPYLVALCSNADTGPDQNTSAPRGTVPRFP